jgi:NTE family protein
MMAQPPHRSPFADWPRPLAFVLSGGGAFGSVQVGMLKALAERGIEPDLVVGTSAGALHGAALATEGYRALPRLEQLWSSLDRRSLFGRRGRVAFNLLRHRTLADFHRLGGLIDQHLVAGSFEDLQLPFAAVATDALTGDPQLLSTGSIREALLASCAVPGVFPAVEIAGRSYVDGGVAANIPIRQAIAFGARSMVVLDATPPGTRATPPRSFSGALLHSASLMLRSQRAHAIDDIAHRYPIATLPSATPPDIGSFNFGLTEQLLAESHQLAAETLDRWGRDAAESPSSSIAQSEG